MKNYAKVLVFAAIAALVVVSAHAGPTEGTGTDLCELIKSMKNIFVTLRILAFVGAGFYMAAWAWDFISKGEAKMEDMKKKGTGLLVGFTLLFIIGIVLSAVVEVAKGNLGECKQEITGAW